MSDRQPKQIKKDVERLFYGSQSMPSQYSVSNPNSGIKTGKPRPPLND